MEHFQQDGLAENSDRCDPIMLTDVWQSADRKQRPYFPSVSEVLNREDLVRRGFSKALNADIYQKGADGTLKWGKNPRGKDLEVFEPAQKRAYQSERPFVCFTQPRGGAAISHKYQSPNFMHYQHMTESQRMQIPKLNADFYARMAQAQHVHRCDEYRIMCLHPSVTDVKPEPGPQTDYGAQIYVECSLGGIEAPGLVDTGAEVSLISVEVALVLHELGYPWMPTTVTANGFDGKGTKNGR